MPPFLGQPVPGFSTQEFTQLGKRKWIPSHSGRSTSLPSAGQRDTPQTAGPPARSPGALVRDGQGPRGVRRPISRKWALQEPGLHLPPPRHGPRAATRDPGGS